MAGANEHLIQIVDAAMRDAIQRSGKWIACKPGCAQCCHGVFAIDTADVQRLREGLEQLIEIDAPRAARVRERAGASAGRLRKDFPGDPQTGVLAEDPASQGRFEDFANDEPCPALDPDTLRCDLYDSRPLTCRVFGPATRMDDGAIGYCELCYEGATPQQVADCAVTVDIEDAPASVARTIVAFALR